MAVRGVSSAIETQPSPTTTYPKGKALQEFNYLLKQRITESIEMVVLLQKCFCPFPKQQGESFTGGCVLLVHKSDFASPFCSKMLLIELPTKQGPSKKTSLDDKFKEGKTSLMMRPEQPRW